MYKQILTRDQLLDEIGIRALPTEAQDEVLDAVGENIMKSVMLAAILKLPKEAQSEFRRLTDAHDSGGLEQLLKKYIPDLEAFTIAEARKELTAYKETVTKKLAE